MLTLHEPIRLKSARGLSLLSSREMGALAGNYDMTQSSISPSSLLLLFSPQPEFPEDLGGSTSISIRQSSTDVRNLTLSVVNNLLNTIAVNQKNEFTYQDKIHITAMLHKLGINNVQQFMQQVQLLRKEHQSVSQLLELYHNETVQQFASNKNINETQNRYDSRHSTTQQAVTGGSQYYLHNEIYHRLQTGDIYKELHAHQIIPSMPDTFVNNLQLRLSEQLRVSNHLQLNELRRQTVATSQMTLHHHQNSYETGELLPTPTTEQEVLQQASTAMLLATVDNLFTQRFNTTNATAYSWVNVAEQLEQTAYNTLSRFESYHSGQSFEYNNGTQYTQSQLAVYNTEATLLQQLIKEEQQQAVAGAFEARQRLADITGTQLEHLATEEEALAPQDSEQITELQTTTERVTSQITDITRQLLQNAQPFQAPAVSRERQMEPLRELLQNAEPYKQTDEQSQLLQQASKQQGTLINETTTNIIQPATERIFSQLTNILLQQVPAPMNVEDTTPAEILLQQIPDALLQEENEKVLIQQLDAIDRKNREMLTRLQERTVELHREATIPPRPVNPAKLRADALRAITEPEKLFAEMRERQEAPMQHSQTPQVEAMLELAAPEVRTLLEAVANYSNNPQAQLAGLHAVTPLELHQDAQQVIQASRIVENVERELLQTTLRTEQQQTVQQSLQEWTQPPQSQPHTNRPQEIQPVAIVHKSERKVIDEELLELLEQQKTSRTEVIHEEQEQLQVNTVRETNQTTMNQQIVTQSTEEITELINRALTRQMGTISDKVYSQMERKLQMERSRRGRF